LLPDRNGRGKTRVSGLDGPRRQPTLLGEGGADCNDHKIKVQRERELVKKGSGGS
jgi:hypothetical protein